MSRPESTPFDPYDPKQPVVAFAGERVVMDTAAWTVSCDEVKLDQIKPTAFRVVALLARHTDQVLTQSDILSSIWSGRRNRQGHYKPVPGLDTVRQHVALFRRSLSQVDPELADTSRGAIATVATPLIRGYCAVSELAGEQQWSNKTPEVNKHLFGADGRLDINPVNGVVMADRQAVNLTLNEFKFLAALAQAPDQTKEALELMDEIWGHWVSSKASPYSLLRICANRVRRKLREIHPDLGDKRTGAVRTDFGVGYHLASSLTPDD